MSIFVPNTDNYITATMTTLLGAAPGYTYLTQFRDFVTQAGGGTDGLYAYANALTNYTLAFEANNSIDTLASSIVANVGITDATLAATATANVKAFLESANGNYGPAMIQLINILVDLQSDATWGAASTLFINKVNAGYVYSVNTANTSTDLTVLQAAVAVDDNGNVVTPGQTFTLTTGVDVITPDQADSTKKSTSGDDTFRADATANSLNTTDTVDGGAGTDTLNVLFTDSTGVKPVLKNIEKIVLSDVAGTTASSLVLTDATGVQEVWVKTSGAGGATMTVSDIALATKLGVTGTIANDAVFTYKATDVAGTSDTGTLLVKEAVAAGAAKVSALGVETLNMVVSDDSTTTGNVSTLNSLIITNTKTLNITGEVGTLTLGGNATGVSNFTGLTKVDASGLKGNFALDLTNDVATGGTTPIPTAGVTLLPSNTGTNTLVIEATNNLNDVLKFTSANVSTINKMTTMTGFDAGTTTATEDKLDISAFALGADTTIGTSSVIPAGDIAGFFSGTDRIQKAVSGADLMVYVDANKDGNFNAGSDLAIKLVGVAAADFLIGDVILA